jgi:hypothetical protein
MYYKRNNETRSCNHCCSGEAIIIMYFECLFVGLIMCKAKRVHRAPCTVHRIILSSVACPTLAQYFSTLSHKRHDFRKKKLLNTPEFKKDRTF